MARQISKGTCTFYHRELSKASIPRYSDQAFAATIACCDYLYQRNDQIPATNGPFRALVAYQAHHLDADFYKKFYRLEAIG